MKGERLGEFEELILLAVRMEDNEASGVQIQTILESDARRSVSLGAIYAALDRLARKGYVDSWLGEPTPIRGGRRKRVYQVTPRGHDVLKESRDIRNVMWSKAVEEAAR